MSNDDFDEFQEYRQSAVERFLASAPEREVALTWLASHKNVSVRVHLIGVASRAGLPDLVPLWNRLIDDPEWMVRMSACEEAYVASLEVSPERVLTLVREDEDESVRFYASLLLLKVSRRIHCRAILELADIVTGTDHEGRSVREILVRAAHLAEMRTG